MNIKKILKPTKSKLLFFIVLFAGVHVLNLILIFLVAGFWDAGLSVGFPISFYVLSCGLVRADFVCNYGFNVLKLLINVLFWYGVVIIIKRNE